MISQLQVESYNILESHIKADSDYDPKKKMGISIEVKRSHATHKENTKRFRVTMQVIIEHSSDQKKRNCPYEIDVTAIGYFQFIKLPNDKNQIERYYSLNAMPILYSLIRGYVSQMTAMGPTGRFILPTLDFAAMDRKSKASTPIKPKALKPSPVPKKN